MANTVYYYKIWCETESTWVYKWDDSEPTTCPNNVNHVIDTTKTTIENTTTESSYKESDGRVRAHITPRPIGTRWLYSSRGDKLDDITDVGNGDFSEIVHNVGDSTNQNTYIDFNTINNETHFYMAIVSHQNAQFDMVTMDAVPRVTPYEIGENTNYNLYNGYLIVPAAGDGVINVDSTSVSLFQVLPNEVGYKSPAFWNADFNTSTNEFENITAAPFGDGDYNMFATEIVLARIANQLRIFGSSNSWTTIPSHDTQKIPHGMRLRLNGKTQLPDHQWIFSINMVLFRQKNN